MQEYSLYKELEIAREWNEEINEVKEGIMVYDEKVIMLRRREVWMYMLGNCIYG